MRPAPGNSSRAGRRTSVMRVEMTRLDDLVALSETARRLPPPNASTEHVWRGPSQTLAAIAMFAREKAVQLIEQADIDCRRGAVSDLLHLEPVLFRPSRQHSLEPKRTEAVERHGRDQLQGDHSRVGRTESPADWRGFILRQLPSGGLIEPPVRATADRLVTFLTKGDAFCAAGAPFACARGCR